MSKRFLEQARLEEEWWISVASQLPREVVWGWIEELHGSVEDRRYLDCHLCPAECDGTCRGDNKMPLPLYAYVSDTHICHINLADPPHWIVIKAVNWVQKNGILPDAPDLT